MKYPENIDKIKTGRKSFDNYIRDNYPDFYSYLESVYPDIINIKEKLYLFYNNASIGKCPVCGKPTKFINFKKGYSIHCCPKCSQLDENTRKKQYQTNIEKYGEDFVKDRISKALKTKKEKYGSTSYNNKEKYKKTCLEKYGVDNPLKDKNILDKVKNTNKEKYGVEYILMREDVRNKLNRKIFENNPDIIRTDGDMLICKCPDPVCNLCKEREFTTSYYTYYERKNIYKRDICTTRTPLYSIQTETYGTSIEEWVRKLLDRYNIKYICNSRNIPDNRKELDIFIPDKNIAIECNGCYWHSSIRVKDKKAHYNKFIECKEKGIQLITIWEDQILKMPEKVTAIILSKLGIYNTRIFARKCTIKEIQNNEYKEFLNKYHLQNYVSAKIKLGLYYNNELVSVMSFGQGRKCLRGDKNSFELYRYCCKSGYQVIGGASKLFKYFNKIYNINNSPIVSFSSNDISNGGLYKNLGFKYQSSTLSYWYIKNKERYHRYKFNKSNLMKLGFDKNKSESEIMMESGFLKIYDSGQSKWSYQP